METLSFIHWCLEHLSYWTIALLMAIESSFIPFPSEIVIPPAAFKASMGDLNIYLVVISGTIGACIGALVNYLLARYLGRPIIYKLAESKVGRILLLSKEKLNRSEVYFDDKGAISTLVGRLIPGIRQLISIPAGLARMHLVPFLIYTAIGAGIWNTVLALLGYYGPSWFGINNEKELVAKVSQYSHEIGLIILIVTVAIVSIILLKKRFKKRK